MLEAPPREDHHQPDRQHDIIRVNLVHAVRAHHILSLVLHRGNGAPRKAGQLLDVQRLTMIIDYNTISKPHSRLALWSVVIHAGNRHSQHH